MDLFVGDLVRTPDGDGYVEEVVRWRDRLIELSDLEAREFSGDCRLECGPEYQERWGLVRVRVRGTSRQYRLVNITVLEGRDG